ncbi:hypothetical protein ZWY2020_007462 [Hordeum vulgare]|nr:hypothetical protein ZWY2020_007462 [Hordeum vulgare]
MLDPEDEEEDETKNDIKQLERIFRVLGVPDERTWPGCTSLPLTVNKPQLLPAGHKHSRLRDLFPEDKLSEEGFQVYPEKRLTAAAALKHPVPPLLVAPPPPPLRRSTRF